MSTTRAQPQEYAGQRLGLPQDGPRSVAPWSRRIMALLLDVVASALVARGILGLTGWSDGYGLVPTLVLVLEMGLLTALAGGSFGQLALRLAVVRVHGGPVPVLHAFVRTLLICLIVPPVVYNRDGRGLHDLAVGTVVLRR
jgi:uncharacterized RDD family membrane protein YckC